jgi:trk system potassium uptake protein TrkA
MSSQRVLVIGLGRFGSALADSLTQNGCEVMAADLDMDNVDAIKHKVAHAIQLDGSDPEALRSIDIAKFSAVVVAIGESFEASALIVAAARETGARMVIARALTPRHARILHAAGAARVIELEAEMGDMLGRELARQKVGG